MSELSQTDLELHPALLVILTSIKPLSKKAFIFCRRTCFLPGTKVCFFNCVRYVDWPSSTRGLSQIWLQVKRKVEIF
jgi:hypothetical protein